MARKTNFEIFVDAVSTHLPNGPLKIVEAGGNNCEHTIKFKELYPAATIHVFECNPHNIALCEGAITGYKNIILHKHALGNREGTIEFYPMPENQAASSVFRHKTAQQETIQTEVKKLDIKADILWLDAEGSELDILKGYTHLSETKLIHTEIHFKEAFEGQPLYKDVKKYLNKNGFTLLRFSSLSRNFSDAIFINSSIYQRKTPQFFTEALYWFTERVSGRFRVIKNRLGNSCTK